MNSNLDEFEAEQPLRPTLLTVLCILTFIGSGWAIISSAIAYSTAPEYVKIFSESTRQKKAELKFNDSTVNKDSVNSNHRKRSPFGEKMMASVSKMMTVDNIHKSAIGTIVSALFTLFGAILMWRLKRNGYFIYIVGIIIGLVVPFYLYGNNFLAVGASSIASFFGLVFIALYALNIKNLK